MNERGGRGLEESKQSQPEAPVTGARQHAVLVDRAESLDLREEASQPLETVCSLMVDASQPAHASLAASRRLRYDRRFLLLAVCIVNADHKPRDPYRAVGNTL